ncbi:hypothetical protein ABOM_006214 [Aspergillus bombycis]|uniref:Xylanolytic transcriptional activator regulatory domain-containing protein n=1 Tax=Aspergillus bombycis TaxID=109264 RepID=A0A1F7ZZC0_9EURO|nr:hypothetical protein ABOM_006214 [Aspergillus bombycis]OGM44791.1 hypothetical protein ABOM_006214 [Aspergillus bombycis]
MKKECTYTAKVVRTPLTRAHLANVEKRLGQFETALQRLFPTGDVEYIVRSLVHDSSEDGTVLSADLLPFSMPVDNPPLAQGFPNPTLDPSGVPSLGLPWGNIPGADTGHYAVFIDAYFASYHPVYPFIHEASFRAEAQSQPSTAHGLEWHILWNAVLATGAWCHSDVQPGIDHEFYNQAVELLQGVSLLDLGSRMLLQSLLLLHDFAQRSGMQEKSLQYLTIAAHMAMNLGYHRDFPDDTLSLLEKECRRRVWWTLYIFDSCVAKSFGLPLLLPESSFIKTQAVLNIPDEVIASHTSASPELLQLIIQKSLNPETTVPPTEVDGPTLYTGLIAQARFHQMANSIYRILLAYPSVPLHEVCRLETQINVWRDTCPSYLHDPSLSTKSPFLRFAGDRLRICDKNLRILLWRPYLMAWTTDGGNDEHRVAALRCVETARESMQLVLGCMQNRSYPRVAASFLLYCLFHVSLIYCVFLRSSASYPYRASLLQDIQTMQDTLLHSWPSNDAQACHFLRVINRLCTFESPSSASPQDNNTLPSLESV